MAAACQARRLASSPVGRWRLASLPSGQRALRPTSWLAGVAGWPCPFNQSTNGRLASQLADKPAGRPTNWPANGHPANWPTSRLADGPAGVCSSVCRLLCWPGWLAVPRCWFLRFLSRAKHDFSTDPSNAQRLNSVNIACIHCQCGLANNNFANPWAFRVFYQSMGPSCCNAPDTVNSFLTNERTSTRLCIFQANQRT